MARAGLGCYLTQCIRQLALERQLPPQTVSLLFTITNQNIKLTVLRGSRLSETYQSIHCVRQDVLTTSPLSWNQHVFGGSQIVPKVAGFRRAPVQIKGTERDDLVPF